MKKDLWKLKFRLDGVLTERIKLMKPFIKKYGHPVLVHAVHDRVIFEKILKEGNLDLPNNHGGGKKSYLMEKFLGVDNCLFLSAGFDYWVNYGFKYNLIFDWGILKDSDYYARPLPYKCYVDIVDYWRVNDPEYLQKLRNYNSECKKVVDKYLETVESKIKKNYFQFWKIEEETFCFIMDYPKKKKLFRIAKNKMKNLKRNYPYSKVVVKRDWPTLRFPEIIHHKKIDLLKSPYFLGFFIGEKIPRRIEKNLGEKYKGKIIFDGKKIRVLK